MTDLFKLILGVLASLFRSRAKLEAEILVLRQQINVLSRRASKRPHLNNTDQVSGYSKSKRCAKFHGEHQQRKESSQTTEYYQHRLTAPTLAATISLVI